MTLFLQHPWLRQIGRVRGVGVALAVSFLVLASVASSASADHMSINKVQCPHVPDGAIRNCANSHEWIDDLARFTHTMRDRYWSSDPASVWFYQSVWTPVITGGNPHYLNYWIAASNGTTVFSDHYGHPLFWYVGSSITLETGVNHLWSSGNPYAAMQVRNTDPSTCASQWWQCVDYGHQNFLFQAAY